MKHLDQKKDSAFGQSPSVLFQFTVSYLLLLLIPIVMGIIGYANSFAAMQKQLLNSNNLILENVMYSLESSLNSMQAYAFSLNNVLYLDRTIRHASEENSDLYSLQQTAGHLPVYSNDRGYVQSYYIYSQKNQLLMAPSQVFLEIEPYYDYFWGKRSGVPYALWKQQVLDSSTTDLPLVILPMRTGENMVYYQRPYVGTEITANGKIFFELNTGRIRKDMERSFDLGAQFFYLFDREENILLYSGQLVDETPLSGFLQTGRTNGTLRLNGESILLMRCHSAPYGLDFVIGIPESYIFERCLYDQRIHLIGTLLMILAAIFLILCSYRYNHRPLTHLAYALPAAEEPAAVSNAHNGLWKLVSFTRMVAQKNADMERQLQEQEHRLREAFLIQLEFGGILDEGSFCQNLERFQLPQTAQACCYGLYLQMQEPPDPTMREELTKAICLFLPELQVVHWLDSRHLSLLYIAQEGICIAQVLKQLYHQLKEQYGMDGCIYVGTPRPLSGVFESFAEARSLIQHTADVPERFLYLYDQQEAKPLNMERYRYSIRQQELLSEAADAGDLDLTRELLQQIYQDNFSQRSISAFMCNLLYCRMVDTLFASRYGEAISDIPADFVKMSPEEFFTYLDGQFMRICRKASDMRAKKQTQNEQNIIRYLGDHYRDSNLSLSVLSMQFGMTEIYLSSLIRKLIGENFQSYIERLRIRDANLMLEEGKLSVGRIGTLVGYENANSFSRAYKRIMGYSPSQHMRYHSGKKE